MPMYTLLLWLSVSPYSKYPWVLKHAIIFSTKKGERAFILPCMQDYLEVFKGFTLTVCGLGMDSKRLYPDFESDVSMGPAGVFSS